MLYNVNNPSNRWLFKEHLIVAVAVQNLVLITLYLTIFCHVHLDSFLLCHCPSNKEFEVLAMKCLVE